jgi:transcriptional regulator with XRE-family HTH domain
VPDKLGHFDAEGFYRALDATRQARQITWKDVAAASGVSASTLSRMAQGKRPDVDSLAALAAWSGLETDRFVRTPNQRPPSEPLALISAQLRSDSRLSTEAATVLEEMIRATYQRLRQSKESSPD